MQNLTPKFRQSSVVSEKTGYLFEKLKTLTSSKFSYVVYIAYLVMIKLIKKKSIQPTFILTTGATLRTNPIGIYLLKVNNRNTRTV